MWIKGLYLEGAGWDRRSSSLMDSRAMELVYPMPTIQFKPVEGKRRSTKGSEIQNLHFWEVGILNEISLRNDCASRITIALGI